MIILERHHQASIYIWVAYAAHAAHAMSKVSKVSAKAYTGHLHNLVNARTKHIMAPIPW